MANIVVLGAGVSGLTSALLLAKQGNKVTIVAKHMPGDYDIEYTSPWAGANVLPMSSRADSRWESRTWPELKRLATEVPAAGIHFQSADGAEKEEESDPLFQKNPWYKSLLDDYRPLTKAELPKGMGSGAEFTSVCINLSIYLPWLVSQCLERGVAIRRATLDHISEAAGLAADGRPADVVINASGLLARRLGGVEDRTVFPIRGQTVLVRNEASPMTLVDDAADRPGDACYIMMRAAGGGTILGGSFQKDDWNPNPDMNLALRIMRRAVELHPQLANEKGIAGLDVIRHGVGLRPAREGGVRIEKELLNDTLVVHNYGHASWGYQGSYGCAERVVELVNEVLAQKGITKAKL